MDTPHVKQNSFIFKAGGCWFSLTQYWSNFRNPRSYSSWEIFDTNFLTPYIWVTMGKWKNGKRRQNKSQYLAFLYHNRVQPSVGVSKFEESRSPRAWEICDKNPLRKHAYSSILKISPSKTENFQMINSDIFHISAQNIDCGYWLEPPRRGGSNKYPQSMFLSRYKKNNVYPWKPQFYYIKVGFKGVKII